MSSPCYFKFFISVFFDDVTWFWWTAVPLREPKKFAQTSCIDGAQKRQSVNTRIKAQTNITRNLPSYTWRCFKEWKGPIINRVTDVNRVILGRSPLKLKQNLSDLCYFCNLNKKVWETPLIFFLFSYWLTRNWLDCLHKFLAISPINFFFFLISIFILVARRLRVNLTPVTSP